MYLLGGGEQMDRPRLIYSRRDFGRMTLGVLPLSVLALRSSKIDGVQIGAITYSFRSMNDPEAIIKAMAQIGLTEAEVMSNHAEALAGAPPLRPAGRGATPDQMAAQQAAQEELRKWRLSVSTDKFKAVAGKFAAAGIEVRLLCYNMGRNIPE